MLKGGKIANLVQKLISGKRKIMIKICYKKHVNYRYPIIKIYLRRAITKELEKIVFF